MNTPDVVICVHEDDLIVETFTGNVTVLQVDFTVQNDGLCPRCRESSAPFPWDEDEERAEVCFVCGWVFAWEDINDIKFDQLIPQGAWNYA